MSDFQQTVDLRGKMERQRLASPAGGKAAMIQKPVTPLEKIYNEENSTEPKKDFKKINQPKIKKSYQGLIKLVVFVLAVLIISAAVYFLFFKNKSWFSGANKTQTWYAVKLVNGETYYGQISDTKADPVVMDNVYYNYNQVKEKDNSKTVDEAGNLVLVKRGKETHGPDGTMDIVRAQVLLMEPLKADSKVLQAILEYEK